jgi:hypothetical protein
VGVPLVCLWLGKYWFFGSYMTSFMKNYVVRLQQ